MTTTIVALVKIVRPMYSGLTLFKVLGYGGEMVFIITCIIRYYSIPTLFVLKTTLIAVLWSK